MQGSGLTACEAGADRFFAKSLKTKHPRTNTGEGVPAESVILTTEGRKNDGFYADEKC